jgi:hypothetical protein
VDIINRGFSGYNTAMILPIAKEMFAQQGTAEIAFWTLWLGANDAGQSRLLSRLTSPCCVQRPEELMIALLGPFVLSAL